MNDTAAKWGTLALLSLVWGTTWIAIKISVNTIPPLTGAAMRFALALLILFAVARMRGIDLTPPAGAFRAIFWSAFFLYPMDYGLIYWGEQYLNAGTTAVFFATFPLFTAVSANFLFRSEPFRWPPYIGLMLGFAGTTVVFFDQLDLSVTTGLTALAAGAVLLSALSAALSLVITKVHLGGMSSLSLTLHQMLWGTLMLAVLSGLAGEWPDFRVTPGALAAVAYLGVVGSAMAFVLYYWLLKTMSAIALSYIIYVTPLVALVAGWLALGEVLSWQTLAGTVIIFTGIALSRVGTRRRPVSAPGRPAA